MQAIEQLQLTRAETKVRAARRASAEKGLRAFAHLYFGHHLKCPPSKMHEELYTLLEDLPPGGRLAVAGPRGSAKSTLVTLIYILWMVCFRRSRYVVILSDTQDKAAEFLGHVKDELVQNERLSADFPEVCEASRDYPKPPRWRKGEIITANGVKVSALGLGQNIRGTRNREQRPDLIILDDVESRENSATPDGRAKVAEWFNKSVLKSGTSQTRVIVVGTIQHYDSLLAKLTDAVQSPFWTARIYRSVIGWSSHAELWETWTAILHKREEYEGQVGPVAAKAFFSAHEEAMQEGTEVLWPEVEDYYALMLMREAEGPASFDSEKQNEPVNPQECYFLEEDIRFWDDAWESEGALVASLEKNAQFLGACDPSLGKQGKNADDSAIITLLRDTKSGTLYVVDADIARRKPDRLMECLLSYQRIRKYARFGIETNQFQDFLKDELERRSKAASLYMRVEGINHTTDKVGRIQSLQSLVRSGALQFSKRHKVLLDQLRFFPKAAHDDGPDALEMAVQIARNLGRGPTMEDWKLCIEMNKKLRSMPVRTKWDCLFGSGSARDLAGLF